MNPILTENRTIKQRWKVKTIEDHIAESVFPCPNTGCWWWAGTIDANTGYGQLSMDHKTVRAHRAMYQYFHNRVLTPDIFLRHKCDNKLCVNPDHLIEGNHQDNMNDMTSRNRQAKGSRNGGHKLVEEQVLEIKKQISLGRSDKSLGDEYGVHRDTIKLIRKGIKWGWLNG